jgi:zinc/manganese transport system permease protein
MLDYDFMQNAFEAATVVAIVSGLAGYFLVLRGQAFAAHALSHVGFTGATAAVLIGTTPLWGMILATVASGIGIGLMGERLHQRDVAIGIVLALMLGLGLLFLHFFTAYATQATALLFGNVLAVDVRTVWTLLAVGVAWPRLRLSRARCYSRACSLRWPRRRACRSDSIPCCSWPSWRWRPPNARRLSACSWSSP